MKGGKYMKGMKAVAGIIAGAVAGYMVKRQMDKKTFNAYEDIVTTYEEIIFDAKPPVDPDDVTRKYPPSLAWICDHCDALMLFHDSPQRVQDHIDDLKEYDGLICPECNQINMIDEITRKIIHQ
jgi:hypothetical protein